MLTCLSQKHLPRKSSLNKPCACPSPTPLKINVCHGEGTFNQLKCEYIFPVLPKANSHTLKIKGDFQPVEKIKLVTVSSNIHLARPGESRSSALMVCKL